MEPYLETWSVDSAAPRYRGGAGVQNHVLILLVLASLEQKPEHPLSSLHVHHKMEGCGEMGNLPL
jgi:hypothetical protein